MEDISTFKLLETFPDAESARVWLEDLRWGGEDPICPLCGGTERITARKGARRGYYVCGDCKGEFTVRTGTVMERSHIPLHKWVYAMHALVTRRKGISSCQLAREIGVSQKSAWFLLSRIREACGDDGEPLSGIVEVDETFVGGKEKNKHACKKLHAGRGHVGKQPVFGMRERGGMSRAFPVPDVRRVTLEEAIVENVAPGSTIFSDEHGGYFGLNGLGYHHEAVSHSIGHYVTEETGCHCNAAESMWACLKRGIYGTWHNVSRKHLHRYVNEVTFRLNEGNMMFDTMDRIVALASASFKVRLTWRELVHG